jgi:hypothetical protein
MNDYRNMFTVREKKKTPKEMIAELKKIDDLTEIEEEKPKMDHITGKIIENLIEMFDDKTKIVDPPTLDWDEPTMSKEKLEKIKEQAEAERLVWEDSKKKAYVMSNNPANLWNVDPNAGIEWNQIINKPDLTAEEIGNWHRKWIKNFPAEELEVMIPIIVKRTFARIIQFKTEKKQTALAMLNLVKERITILGAKPLNQKEEAQTWDEIMKRPLETMLTAIKLLLKDIKIIKETLEEANKKFGTNDPELMMEADEMMKQLRKRFASIK